MSEEDDHLVGYDPVAAFEALAFGDQAFMNITCHDHLLAITEEDVLKAGGQVPIPFKPELLEKYTLRAAKGGKEIDGSPLRYATCAFNLKAVMANLGYVNGKSSSVNT